MYQFFFPPLSKNCERINLTLLGVQAFNLYSNRCRCFIQKTKEKQEIRVLFPLTRNSLQWGRARIAFTIELMNEEKQNWKNFYVQMWHHHIFTRLKMRETNIWQLKILIQLVEISQWRAGSTPTDLRVSACRGLRIWNKKFCK